MSQKGVWEREVEVEVELEMEVGRCEGGREGRREGEGAWLVGRESDLEGLEMLRWTWTGRKEERGAGEEGSREDSKVSSRSAKRPARNESSTSTRGILHG